MPKPSVLLLNRAYPPVRGATGRVLRDLARAMAAQGWHVTVVTTGPKACRERDGPVRIVRVKAHTRPRRLFSYMMIWIKLFWAALRLRRRDLVVTMTDPPLLAVAGRLLARSKGSRHIHWCQDLYPDLLPAMGVNPPDFIMKRLTRWAYEAMASCDKVVVIGRCMARRLVRNGLEPARISVIPNWPDRELVARRPCPANNNTQDESAATAPKFRVLYSGTMGRAHPTDTIVAAARILSDSHPEIEFVFVGDGAGFNRMARERAALGLDNIRLIPWQPVSRLRDLMESGDVHLISMNPEAAGMIVPCKLYSALAVARPCILVGPSHSETARIIHDYKAGAVVPQGDARLLADTILRFRFSSEAWYAAHDGARRAGEIFVPEQSIRAWIHRAHAVVRPSRMPRPLGTIFNKNIARRSAPSRKEAA